MNTVQYNSLKDLINESASSRRFFLSLPARMQSQLREMGGCIHSAAELRLTADRLENHAKAVNISNLLDRYFH